MVEDVAAEENLAQALPLIQGTKPTIPLDTPAETAEAVASAFEFKTKRPKVTRNGA